MAVALSPAHGHLERVPKLETMAFRGWETRDCCLISLAAWVTYQSVWGLGHLETLFEDAIRMPWRGFRSVP